MQRLNNAGGPDNSLWTSERGLVSNGSNFTGQNRNLQHPATFTGHDGRPVFRYPLTSPQPNPLTFRPGWGQADQDSITQQTVTSSLWNSASSSGRNIDDTRSLLGTEQWGRESGGAPWGTATPLEQTTITETTASSGVTDSTTVLRHRWLATQNSSVVQSTQEKDAGHATEEVCKSTDSSKDIEVSPEEKLASSIGKSSPVVSEATDSGDVSKKSDIMPSSSEPISSNESSTVQEKDKSDELHVDRKNSEPSLTTPEENIVGTSASNPVTTTATDTTITSAEVASTVDSAVTGAIDQLQQITLIDSYQQSIAAQLTSYQLMQQHYAQQLAATPGSMLFPGSYIIPAQSNAAAYTDPATAGQFPVMAHYAPYAASWQTAAGMYPAILQQQMAAAAATVSSQPTASPTSSQPNRALTQTPQSSSQSPSLQQQESSQLPGSDIVAAAVQQNNLNQAAMAMAGYGIVPSPYYDHSGAFIINNARNAAPVRLFTPNPMLVNGSQPWIPPQLPGNGSMFRYNPIAQQQAVAANAMYANQQGANNSTLHSVNQGFSGAPSVNFGSSGNISSLGTGPLGSAVGSNNSTPQRKDSFSDYSKLSQQYGGMSQFYGSFGVSSGGGSGIGLGAVSPSPGPFGNLMAHPHPGLNSPPPSMSPNNMVPGVNTRMFSAAPGAEAKYRNGQFISPIGSSGSSLFPPTRIRPHVKDAIPHGRSKLLDDFRNNRLSNPLLQELSSHIVEFSQDQHGSRFIQQKLERASPSEKQQVFNEIIGSAHHLMTDVFGNYVIQKFFEFGSQEHKLALADCIHGHVLPLALQMYGCRVIQKALECIPPEKQVKIVQELDGHLMKCVKDQNGNHVVQKCIECVPPKHLQFIVDGFKGQVVALSSHPYGCRVMQRILEHCTEDQTAPILDELHQHTEMLVKDQYGNYVIQHVLERGHPEHKSQMVNELRGKILNLSQHKFASNVIEKCVSHSSPQNRAWLIDEVCQEPDALFIMMKDQFANYVVQKMLDVAEPQQKKLLIQKIRPHILTLRKFTYGKHIITKLDKFFQKSGGIANSGAGTSGTDLSPSQLSAANWGLDTKE